MFIQHGFSTIVTAKSIGRNFTVLQQVTIGYTTKGCPTICDNVKICAGAIVVGDIIIHDNAIIGAGAVVTKDVPANAVVAGNPAKVIGMQNDAKRCSLSK